MILCDFRLQLIAIKRLLVSWIKYHENRGVERCQRIDNWTSEIGHTYCVVDFALCDASMNATALHQTT